MIMERECDSLLEEYRTADFNDKKLIKFQIDTKKMITNSYKKEINKVILQYSDVVFSTLQGAANPLLEIQNSIFDIVIVDECSQATEIANWTAILKAKKLIIAGDRLQLPPFLVSPEAKKMDLDYTLFDKLRARLPKNLQKILRIQYRMNEKIMAWSNEQFYKGKLIANDVCAQYTLQEYLKEDSPLKANEVPVLVLIDTAGFGFPERSLKPSFINLGEAALVLEQVDDLLTNYNLRPDDIGVISTYSGQAELIGKVFAQNERTKGIRCSTVDLFQGKEKEAIIISLVRSNSNQTIGFLSDAKRMNVAVTRARRFVAIICDTATMIQPNFPFLTQLVKQFTRQGQVKRPNEFKNILKHQSKLETILDPLKSLPLAKPALDDPASFNNISRNKVVINHNNLINRQAQNFEKIMVFPQHPDKKVEEKGVKLHKFDENISHKASNQFSNHVIFEGNNINLLEKDQRSNKSIDPLKSSLKQHQSPHILNQKEESKLSDVQLGAESKQIFYLAMSYEPPKISTEWKEVSKKKVINVENKACLKISDTSNKIATLKVGPKPFKVESNIEFAPLSQEINNLEPNIGEWKPLPKKKIKVNKE